MKKNNIIVGIIVILAVAAVAVLMAKKNPATVSSPASSSALPPLTTNFPRDNNRFSVSSGKTTGPQFHEGYLDSFYPASPGDTQTMSLKASDNSPIVSILVTVNTDNKRATYPLKLVEGDTVNGMWKGSWTVSDTHDRVYNIIIYAADKTTSSSVQITLK